MGRQQAGPPPGIFSSPVTTDMLGAWAVPALACLGALAGGGLWLAGAVSALAAGTRPPGNPVAYATALAAGRAPWPDAWGWAALVAGVAALASTGIIAGHVMAKRAAPRHRVDQVARYLSSRRDRARLAPQARKAQSARLSSGAPDWAGSPLGRTVPGKEPASSGPEDVSVDLWGARQGKTTKRVIPAILDAPGPVLATTNKRDVSDETGAFRARRGKTWLFDPQGIASDGEPTFTYDPLRQVTDVAAAQRLAAIFEASTREPGARTDAHWDTAGRDLLAWLFLAAACAGLPMARAWEWLSNPDDATPAVLLRKAGHDGPAAAVEGVLGQPDKMRGSTYGTAQRMARALVNPRLLAWVTPADGLPEFDPAAFPGSSDTLYALSKEGEGSGGPFVAALTAHVCEAAERMAASARSGRLPVPLVVELDEAANIVRWPELPKLYSHYGSRGILLHCYLQSWTQAAEAWGEYGVRAMWSAATVRVLGAGVADEKFLSECSALIGDREEWVLQSASTGRHGERQATRALRKDRAMAVSDLASMPSDRAIVFASGCRPVVIQTCPWRDGPHADAVREAQAERCGAEQAPMEASQEGAA